MSTKILIVDDEKAMTLGLKDNLMHEGYAVKVCYNGVGALDALKADRYDLVLLDVMMPKMTGFELLEVMHREKIFTPVIFLTARTADEDKLQGMGLGADDYITKPFNILLLIARIKAVLRRTKRGSELTLLTLGDCRIDLQCQEMTTPKGKQMLGRYEVNLLRLLGSEPGKVFSRDQILDEVWGADEYPSNRTVDNYVVKLRQKIELNSKEPRYLVTVYGVGYRLQMA